MSKVKNVQEMFGRIAKNYDLMNRLITFGMDRYWRRILIKSAKLSKNVLMLDIGAGTGDIAIEAYRFCSEAKIFATDITPQMINIGRLRCEKIKWCLSNALSLPFPDSTFDVVSSGYLIRNTIDVKKAFEEQKRVLKSGGRIVCLETSPPKENFLKFFILIYLKFVIPMIGQIISKDKTAYTYLPSTTQAFLTPEALLSVMSEVGFNFIKFKRLMFGTQVIISGIK